MSLAAENIQKVEANCIAEITLDSATTYQNPFIDVVLDALVTAPDRAQMRVPVFWAGGNRWIVRFSSGMLSLHAWTLDFSDTGNSRLHGVAAKM